MFASQQTEETEPEQRRGDTKKTQCRMTQKHTQKTQREKPERGRVGMREQLWKTGMWEAVCAQRKEPWTSSPAPTSREYGNHCPIWICGPYNFTQYSGQLWGGVTWISEREASRRIIDSVTELIPWVAALIKIVRLWGWGRTHTKGWPGRGLHKTVTRMSSSPRTSLIKGVKMNESCSKNHCNQGMKELKPKLT